MSTPIPPRRPVRRTMGAPTPISIPTPVSIGIPTASSSTTLASSRSFPPSTSRSGKSRTCPNCDSNDIEDMGGQSTCLNCGTVLSESDIVTEISFGENSQGGATVQGGIVGDNQRYARPTGKAFQRMGGGGGESREQSLRNGRDAISALAHSLHVPHAVDPACGMFSLAHSNGFVQGRPTQTVAAVCLYVSCRRQNGNTVLLIDLAEKIQLNVYTLGNVYKALLSALYLNYHDAGVAAVVEIEPLLLKYAQRLEFGEKTNAVAADAAQILSRMNRDWMVTGRTPNGLCGACLVLAARMNNFRRSIREVVFVVKTSDATVLHRLSEFRRTTAGQLTVDDFRKFSKRLKTSHDPPSLYRAEERAHRIEMIRQKRKLAAAGTNENELKETLAYAARSEGSVTPSASSSSATTPITNGTFPRSSATNLTVGPRAIVNGIEIDASPDEVAALLNEDGLAPLAKRRKKIFKPTRVLVSDDDIHAEELLENEINALLDYSVPDDVFAGIEARARVKADERRGESNVPDTPDICQSEFDNDPEVANCLLTEKEIEIKERIWVTMNADWLRDQQIRQIQKEKSDLLDSVRPSRKKRKVGRLGDGSLLRDSGPVSSAAEATARMLEKRLGHNASKKVNYDLLQKAYGGSTDFVDESRERMEKVREEKRMKDAEKRNTRLNPSATTDDQELEPESADEQEDAMVDESTVNSPLQPAFLLTPPATQLSASQAAAVAKPMLTPPAIVPPPKIANADGDELEVVEEFDEDDDGDGTSSAPATAKRARNGDEDDEDEDEDEDDDEEAYAGDYPDANEEPEWNDLGYDWDGGA